jgi:hypothetical protein
MYPITVKIIMISIGITLNLPLNRSATPSEIRKNKKKAEA